MNKSERSPAKMRGADIDTATCYYCSTGRIDTRHTGIGAFGWHFECTGLYTTVESGSFRTVHEHLSRELTGALTACHITNGEDSHSEKSGRQHQWLVPVIVLLIPFYER
jgi:hypothetical protein